MQVEPSVGSPGARSKRRDRGLKPASWRFLRSPLNILKYYIKIYGFGPARKIRTGNIRSTFLHGNTLPCPSGCCCALPMGHGPSSSPGSLAWLWLASLTVNYLDPCLAPVGTGVGQLFSESSEAESVSLVRGEPPFFPSSTTQCVRCPVMAFREPLASLLGRAYLALCSQCSFCFDTGGSIFSCSSRGRKSCGLGLHEDLCPSSLFAPWFLLTSRVTVRTGGPPENAVAQLVVFLH